MYSSKIQQSAVQCTATCCMYSRSVQHMYTTSTANIQQKDKGSLQSFSLIFGPSCFVTKNRHLWHMCNFASKAVERARFSQIYDGVMFSNLYLPIPDFYLHLMHYFNTTQIPTSNEHFRFRVYPGEMQPTGS